MALSVRTKFINCIWIFLATFLFVALTIKYLGLISPFLGVIVYGALQLYVLRMECPRCHVRFWQSEIRNFIAPFHLRDIILGRCSHCGFQLDKTIKAPAKAKR